MQVVLFTMPITFALWSVHELNGYVQVRHYWHQQDYNFVHQIQVKYVRPILMDDLITVTARVISCKAASFVLQQNIYRGEILLASGEVTLACLNKELMPRRLPEEIRDLIQKN
jgi:acyl-CoA thioester hydrolase